LGAELFAVVSFSAETGVERMIKGLRSEAMGMKVLGARRRAFLAELRFNILCLGFADELRIGRKRVRRLRCCNQLPSRDMRFSRMRGYFQN